MIIDEIKKATPRIDEALSNVDRRKTHRDFYTYNDTGLDNEGLKIDVSYLFETSSRYHTLRFDLNDVKTKRSLFAVLLKDFSHESIQFALSSVREYAKKYLCALDFR